MIERRPYAELGGANHGWLDTRHHFSFASYYDPERMNWGRLRVWNDDAIAPGTGFPPHPHANMEILTYVRSGAISHADSLGNRGRTVAGDVQVMSAGTGITHAEYNHEQDTTEIFQIWIEPTSRGQAPSWGTKPFPKADRAGQFVVLASGYAEDSEALPLRTNARVLGALVEAGGVVQYPLEAGEKAYLVPASGRVSVNGVVVEARDGVAIKDEGKLEVRAEEEAEVVLVVVGAD